MLWELAAQQRLWRCLHSNPIIITNLAHTITSVYASVPASVYARVYASAPASVRILESAEQIAAEATSKGFAAAMLYQLESRPFQGGFPYSER